MKIKKVLSFTDEDVKAVTKFRTEVFHPMCNLLENHCELCPFNDACSNIEEFLDKIVTDKHWYVPERGE